MSDSSSAPESSTEATPKGAHRGEIVMSEELYNNLTAIGDRLARASSGTRVFDVASWNEAKLAVRQGARYQ